jgi:ribose transport system ATP-binding protein
MDFFLGNKIVLSLRNITKLYPGVMALNNVSVDFEEGEIHAIVGENGAGKSTLIKAVAGAIQPDNGEIIVNDTKFQALTPTLSRKSGISIIYQEFNLIPVMSAAENIFLGEFIRNGWVCDNKKMKKMTTVLFERLKINIDPDTLVEDLSTGYQQIVEIAKAVSKNAKILIMDEPSAPLTNTEVEIMFDVIRMLQKQGVTIIYISHRMEEIFKISNRVTVMRDGKYIITLKTSETNRNELIKFMVGRQLSETFPQREENNNPPILSIQNLSGNGLRDISFDVKKGEILGLAGLMGAGRTELAQLLFGYKPIKSGKVILNGKQVHIKSPIDAVHNGIALVPEDRKRQGLILEMTIKENITMPLLKEISKVFVTPEKQECKISAKYIKDLNIKTSGMHQFAKNLSGGNQQKVVLGKWLSTNPEILIMDEPTRGIDVNAKQEIYKIMDELVKRGKTIIMISSDMDELIGMADRLVVLCRGRVSGIIEKNMFSQEHILKKSEGSDYNEKVS